MSVIKIADQIVSPVTARMVIVTDVEVLKKGGRVGSQFAGQPIPSKMVGLKRLVSEVVNIGNDYTQAVENQLSKSIKKDFPILTAAEAKTAAGHIWQTDEHAWAEVDPNYSSGNIYRNKDPQKRQKEIAELGEYKKYLKHYERMSSQIQKGTMFDPKTGIQVNVSWDEMVAFCQKNPEKSGSKKQEDAGLDKQVRFRLVALENIRYLRCGDLGEYNALSPQEESLLKAL